MEAAETPEQLVKICFPLSEDWHGGEAEWLWAEPIGEEVFVLRNVPFFAKNVSFGDSVRIRNEAGKPVVRSIMARGGHSTYRVFALQGREDPRITTLLKKLERLGCEVEVATDKLIGIDVLPHADIHAVYAAMQEAESEGYIDFQEGHCGHQVKG